MCGLDSARRRAATSRAFCDSTGDEIGERPGLDHEDIGVRRLPLQGKARAASGPGRALLDQLRSGVVPLLKAAE